MVKKTTKKKVVTKSNKRSTTKKLATKSNNKKLNAATKKTAKKSTQHVKAGKLGGLAPHACRGRECTKLSARQKALRAKKLKK